MGATAAVVVSGKEGARGRKPSLWISWITSGAWVIPKRSRAGRLGRHPMAATGLNLQVQLGLAPRTIDAYGRALADYLSVCERDGIDQRQDAGLPGGAPIRPPYGFGESLSGTGCG